MALVLYDLAGANPKRRFSPYCWRVRMALRHKGLRCTTVPWRFTDIAVIAPSGQGKVPVLVDGKRWISDSWTIASHLENAYADRPSLFARTAAGRSLTQLYSALGDTLVTQIFRFVALDILDHLHAKDRPYFRRSREARIGMTLEAFIADRNSRLAAFRASLEPLRVVLKLQPFFGGSGPLYADYALFGAFQWARCVSTYPLLAADDPVQAWRDRLLDAFDGFARQSPSCAP